MSTCLRCIPGVTLRNWHDPYRRNMELTPHWLTGGKSQSPVRSALMNWSRVITTDKYWSQKAKRLDLARASLLNSPTRVIREFGPSLTGCQLSWGPPSVSWHFWMSSSTSSFEASWKQGFFLSSQLINALHRRRNSAARQSLWALTPRLYDFPPIDAFMVSAAYNTESISRSLNKNWCRTSQGATDNSMLYEILPSGLQPSWIPMGTLVAAVFFWCKLSSQKLPLN